MSRPCEDSGHQRGVYVETWSGDNNGAVCTLNSGNKVLHMVRVENLMLYPAAITCKGSIANNPRRVDFNSTHAGDTAVTWNGQHPNLGGGLHCVFNHCALTALGTGIGDELIDTEVTIFWRQRGIRKVIPLSIRVDT